jgi:hypothetical protein
MLLIEKLLYFEQEQLYLEQLDHRVIQGHNEILVLFEILEVLDLLEILDQLDLSELLDLLVLEM